MSTPITTPTSSTSTSASAPTSTSTSHSTVTASVSAVSQTVEKPLSPPEPSPAAAEIDTNGTTKHELDDAADSEAKRAKVEDVSVVTTVTDQTDLPVSESTKDEEGDVSMTKDEADSSLLTPVPATAATAGSASAQPDQVPQQQTSVLPLPSEPAPKPPSEPDMDNLPTNPIPKHQQIYSTRAIKIIKRMKDAVPFLTPVDTVKLNIPFYYNYIPRPMDLSTIEKKLAVNAYADVKDLIDDFNLMVANCSKFNGVDSVIAQMARNIQASFEKHMLNVPARELPPNAKTTAGGRRKPTTPVVSPSTAAPGTNAGELNAEGVPVIRREGNHLNGRPKREIHPPKPKDMPYDTRPRKKKFVAELRFSQSVLKELMSKKHESYNFPFMTPVDPVALNCPTYFDYVKEPMDFSTIQNKLNNNQYENADEFEHDIRLVFKNCYLFNPEGTSVNMMGHRLEALFDKKWVDKPVAPPTPVVSDVEVESEEESEEEEVEEEEEEINESAITNPAIQFLEEQLERMKQQLAKLKKDELDKIRKERAAKKKKTKRAANNKNKKKKAIKRVAYDANTVITYDMKKELSEKIGELSEKKLNQALAIISESLNLNNQSGEEIELDMDQLDNVTLLKLYSFVVKKKSSSSRRAQGASSSAHAGAKKSKKNKNLTEAEQNKQIEDLKKKIELLDGANTPNQTSTLGDNSDDDSGDDDVSESSEEE